MPNWWVFRWLRLYWAWMSGVRIGRFRLGNGSSEKLVSDRLRLVFEGIDSSAARGALLACFWGGIVTVLCCIPTCVLYNACKIFRFSRCPANGTWH
jgi:hypothetical protein